jgi:hypothetical protein
MYTGLKHHETDVVEEVFVDQSRPPPPKNYEALQGIDPQIIWPLPGLRFFMRCSL